MSRANGRLRYAAIMIGLGKGFRLTSTKYYLLSIYCISWVSRAIGTDISGWIAI